MLFRLLGGIFMRRTFIILVLAVTLAGCGPASRLTWSQRAYIHCSETLRDTGACIPAVTTAWERLAGACGIRNNVMQICDAEFDRLYGCQVSTREVKRTDDQGKVTTIKEEIRTGPGCSMDSGRLFQLERAFESECMAARDPPDTSSREGASCDCSYGSCTFVYPHVADETAVRYFPETAN